MRFSLIALLSLTLSNVASAKGLFINDAIYWLDTEDSDLRAGQTVTFHAWLDVPAMCERIDEEWGWYAGDIDACRAEVAQLAEEDPWRGVPTVEIYNTAHASPATPLTAKLYPCEACEESEVVGSAIIPTDWEGDDVQFVLFGDLARDPRQSDIALLASAHPVLGAPAPTNNTSGTSSRRLGCTAVGSEPFAFLALLGLLSRRRTKA